MVCLLRFAPYQLLEDAAEAEAGQGEELALAYANRSAVLGIHSVITRHYIYNIQIFHFISELLPYVICIFSI